MIDFESELFSFENGVLLGRVTIDGEQVHAGITLPAFERLMTRAGFNPDGNLGEEMVSEMLARLRPTIEAYLQSKHFIGVASENALIIEMDDLVTH